MKIAVLFNCQGAGLAASLQALLPDARVTYFPLRTGTNNDDETNATLAALLASDYVISNPLGREMGKLATPRLQEVIPNYHVVPTFGFRGFHPDQIYIRAGARLCPGPTGDYHSRLAVAGFLAGLSAAEAAGLFQRLAFARLGYFDLYEQDFILLGDEFARFGLDASPMLRRLRGAGCFMHTCNHPKRLPLLEMAAIICRRIGAEPRDAREDSVEDFLALHPSHPVFADIAAGAGVAPEGAFRSFRHPGPPMVALSTQDFVAGSFAAFRDIAREDLRQADGVAGAMAALGLREFLTRKRHGAAISGAALMTWHGTVLCAGPEPAPLHVPVAAIGASAPIMRFDLADSAQRAALGVAAAPHDGMIALQRGGQYLAAEQGALQTFYFRDAPGDRESFLPVAEAELDVLQLVLASEWAAEGSSQSCKPALIGGPALAFGPARIELSRAWPFFLPDDLDGVPRLAVSLDGAPAVLRQTSKPVAAKAPEARKIELGRRIVLTGDSVMLPPPVVAGNAARRWLHQSCGDADGLPWQAESPRVTVSRDENQRLLGEPPEPGHVPNLDSVVGGQVVLVARPGGDPHDGWISPLLRLLVMAPLLPPDTEVIAPGGAVAGQVLADAWQCLGLPPISVVTPPAGLYTARDVVWLDPPAPAAWPAETLRSVRAVTARGAMPGAARIFLRGPAARAIANGDALAADLAAMGFTTIDLTAAAPSAHIPLLRGAGWVMGVGGDLPAAAFCAEGCKIIELSSVESFDPAAWQLSCRLGMTHAVLPCQAAEQGFTVDARQLADLIKFAGFRI